jgi:hypothetical protein
MSEGTKKERGRGIGRTDTKKKMETTARDGREQAGKLILYGNTVSFLKL